MQMRTLAAVALTLGLVGAVAPRPEPALADPEPATTAWTVTAGAQSDDFAVQSLEFFPPTLTLNVGDRVTWHVPSQEFHTITFTGGEAAPDFIVPTPDAGTPPAAFMFNPRAAFPVGGEQYHGSGFLNSGLLDSGETFSATFSQAGTYDYVCAVHPHMRGQLVVQPEGSALPASPAQVEAGAKAAMAASVQHGQRLKETVKVNRQARAGGQTLFEVPTAIGDQRASVMRFQPADLTIRTGDTVRWTDADPQTPHTITFLAGGGAPDVVVPQPQPQGPPLLVLNNQVLMPAGGQTASAAAYLNSGIYGGIVPGPKSYELTFDHPGTYTYVCLLHEEMGMRGRIIVQPGATAAAASPATAAAQLPRAGDVPVVPIVFGGLGLAALGWLVRRRGRQ